MYLFVLVVKLIVLDRVQSLLEGLLVQLHSKPLKPSYSLI